MCFESPFVSSRYLEVMNGCGLCEDFNLGSDEATDDVDIGQVRNDNYLLRKSMFILQLMVCSLPL